MGYSAYLIYMVMSEYKPLKHQQKFAAEKIFKLSLRAMGGKRTVWRPLNLHIMEDNTGQWV